MRNETKNNNPVKTRGFITVATGSEHYFNLAENLIKSYRLFNKNSRFPFAVITEKENLHTDLFDDVIIVENATHSYLDKFLMHKNLPYDENIFIESDMLIYSNIGFVFDIFKNADDFSCIGDVSDINEDSGWFQYSNLPEDIKRNILFNVGLHGGILYVRNSNKSNDIFLTAKQIIKEKERFVNSFRSACFRSLPDEPVLALSMAINKCKPIRPEKSFLSVYPRDKSHFIYNIYKKECHPKANNTDTRSLLHWGTDFTYLPKYRWESYRLDCLYKGKKTNCLKNIYHAFKLLNYNIYVKRINMLERAHNNKTLSSIWHLIKGRAKNE